MGRQKSLQVPPGKYRCLFGTGTVTIGAVSTATPEAPEESTSGSDSSSDDTSDEEADKCDPAESQPQSGPSQPTTGGKSLKRPWKQVYDGCRLMQEQWVAKYPCLGLFLEKLVCKPCSNLANTPVYMKNKLHNISRHVASARHCKAYNKHGNAAFVGPLVLGRDITSDMEKAELAALDAKKLQLTLLVWLLTRKRPVSE